jgi:hypothetical protein
MITKYGLNIQSGMDFIHRLRWITFLATNMIAFKQSTMGVMKTNGGFIYCIIFNGYCRQLLKAMRSRLDKLKSITGENIMKAISYLKDKWRFFIAFVVCRLAIHKYDFIFKAGVYNYYECKYCKKRTVRHNNYNQGYSAIDWKWETSIYYNSGKS